MDVLNYAQYMLTNCWQAKYTLLKYPTGRVSGMWYGTKPSWWSSAKSLDVSNVQSLSKLQAHILGIVAAKTKPIFAFILQKIHNGKQLPLKYIA